MVDFLPIFLRTFLYLATILTAGSLFLASSLSVARGSTLSVHLRKQVVLGIFLLIVIEFARTVLLALQFSDWDMSEAFTAEMISLIFEIAPGYAIITRLIGVGLLLITFGILKSWKLSLIPAILIIAGYLQEGHTVSMEIETNLIWVFKFALFIHLIVFHWWLAALWPLRLMARTQSEDTHSTAELFGKQAVISVPCLLIGGLILLGALLNLPYLSWPEMAALISDPYVQIFIVKLLIVSGLLLIAACNKLWLTPSLQSGTKNPYSKFSRILGLESLVALGVLIATSSAIYVGISS